MTSITGVGASVDSIVGVDGTGMDDSVAAVGWDAFVATPIFGLQLPTRKIIGIIHFK